MSDVIVLDAQSRERVGKGAARQTRREGMVPAVVYGAKTEPTLISLNPIDVMKQVRKEGFFSHVFEIQIKDGKKERTLARDVQFHPVTDEPIHLDFLRVSSKTAVHVQIPVHFENEETCPGLKQGGLLNIVKHDIEVVCNVDTIPESLSVDLSKLEIGASVHSSDLTLPKNVEFAQKDADFTVATIVAPTLKVEEDPEVAAAAEGESEEKKTEEGK